MSEHRYRTMASVVDAEGERRFYRTSESCPSVHINPVGSDRTLAILTCLLATASANVVISWNVSGTSIWIFML